MPRGGHRESSGRKLKWNLGKTKAVRIPEAIADTILEVAKRLDRGESIEPIIIPESKAITVKLSAANLGKSKGQSKLSSA
jgi:hypothetical protein